MLIKLSKYIFLVLLLKYIKSENTRFVITTAIPQMNTTRLTVLDSKFTFKIKLKRITNIDREQNIEFAKSANLLT